MDPLPIIHKANVEKNDCIVCFLIVLLSSILLLLCLFSEGLSRATQSSFLLTQILVNFLGCYWLAKRRIKKGLIDSSYKNLLSFKKHNYNNSISKGTIYIKLNNKFFINSFYSDSNILLSTNLFEGKKITDILYSPVISIDNWLSELKYGLIRNSSDCFFSLDKSIDFKVEMIACKTYARRNDFICLLLILTDDHIKNKSVIVFSEDNEIRDKENICKNIEKSLSKINFRDTVLIISQISVRNITLISEVYGRDVIIPIIENLCKELSSVCSENDFVIKKDNDIIIFSLQLKRVEYHTKDIIQNKIEFFFQELQQSITSNDSLVKPIICAGCVIVNNCNISGSNIISYVQIAFSQTYRIDKENVIFGSESLYKEHEERIIMLGLLTEAIRENQFIVYYQPKYSFINSAVSGAEALIRWYHPNYGFIPPDNFISFAEKVDLIHSITAMVITTVFSFSQQVNNISFSINLSGKDFENRFLLNHIDKMAELYEVNPCRIIFEITESVMITNPTLALNNLTKLKEKGYKIHIDDFGTGYSSLNYLREFPFDAIKLDRTFISGIAHDARDLSIVRSIVSLGKAFSLGIVAEGVENNEQFELLKNMNCDEFQGYYYSKPLSGDQLIDFLRGQKK
ncbi:putative bifunctional diguanylate cyclase/phosphodiesterase [Klebsiella michiganensis]|uniref:putative bifunctional diguanylate cyclase/phosphodiesterase n=1 Tax=Klebsiella michiganensis TaxID=1134687 RepID=UPI0009833F69|nr:EAL domain-containing protein [Klebsiella michiganensis]